MTLLRSTTAPNAAVDPELRSGDAPAEGEQELSLSLRPTAPLPGAPEDAPSREATALHAMLLPDGGELADFAPVSLAPAEVSLGKLVHEALSSAASLLEEHRVSIESEVGLPPVRCDAALIRRVLVLLLRNAARASGMSGQIHVGLLRAESKIALSVTDDGPGIPISVRDALAREATGGEPRGTGVRMFGRSLEFCWRAIGAHGETLTVANGSSGGAVFTFTLPVADEADSSRGSV